MGTQKVGRVKWLTLRVVIKIINVIAYMVFR
jgi:hypothetical protein